MLQPNLSKALRQPGLCIRTLAPPMMLRNLHALPDAQGGSQNIATTMSPCLRAQRWPAGDTVNRYPGIAWGGG